MIDKYIQTITLIGGRYFLVAWISFLFFYFLLKGIVENKKIQSKYPKASDYIREIGFSTLTIFIFGVVPLVWLVLFLVCFPRHAIYARYLFLLDA